MSLPLPTFIRNSYRLTTKWMANTPDTKESQPVGKSPSNTGKFTNPPTCFQNRSVLGLPKSVEPRPSRVLKGLGAVRIEMGHLLEAIRLRQSMSQNTAHRSFPTDASSSFGTQTPGLGLQQPVFPSPTSTLGIPSSTLMSQASAVSPWAMPTTQQSSSTTTSGHQASSCLSCQQPQPLSSLKH